MSAPSVTLTRLVPGREQAAIDSGADWVLGVRSHLLGRRETDQHHAALEAVHRLRRLAALQGRTVRVAAGCNPSVVRLDDDLDLAAYQPGEILRRDDVRDALRAWARAGWDVSARPPLWDARLERDLWATGDGQPVPHCYADSATRRLVTVGYLVDLRSRYVQSAAAGYALTCQRHSSADAIHYTLHADFWSAPQRTRLDPDVPATYEAPITDTPYAAGEYEEAWSAIVRATRGHGLGSVAIAYPRDARVEAPVITWIDKVV